MGIPRRFASLLFIFFFPVLAYSVDGENLGWREDLEFFGREVLDADQSFSGEQRELAEQDLAALMSRFDALSDPAIELELARIMARADNGHSFLMPGGWTQRYNRLPVEFVVFSDGIFVTEATAGHRDKVGLRLVSVDGKPVSEVAATWYEHQGGLPAWNDLYLTHFLESPEVLHAAGIAESAEAVVLEFEDDRGSLRQSTIKAEPGLPSLTGIDLYLAPARLLKMALVQADLEQLPLYLQQPAVLFRSEYLGELDTLYIQFRANSDMGGDQDVEQFVRQVEVQARQLRPSHIIVDQRFNLGGDLNTTRKLMQSIPALVTEGGGIYALSSGRTFSAGISSLGYLKQAAQASLVIVGEPVGDDLEFWAEGSLTVLPNSGVAFLMATERHNYLDGCPEPDCHGAIRRNPIRVETLEPDVSISLRYQDFAAHRDPALDWVLANIKMADQEN